MLPNLHHNIVSEVYSTPHGDRFLDRFKQTGVQKRGAMARNRSKTQAQAEFVLFDVLYEDGSRTSNRKVPSAAIGGLDGDEPARAIIEAQDAEIAERSGRTRGPIKQVVRAGAKAK